MYLFSLLPLNPVNKNQTKKIKMRGEKEALSLNPSSYTHQPSDFDKALNLFQTCFCEKETKCVTQKFFASINEIP
jgi:hypothetical protein